MLLHSQEDADRAAERRGYSVIHRSGRPPTNGEGRGASSNPYKRDAQRRKAERMFGVMQQAGIRSESDLAATLAALGEGLWAQVAEVAGKDAPGETVKGLIHGMYRGK